MYNRPHTLHWYINLEERLMTRRERWERPFLVERALGQRDDHLVVHSVVRRKPFLIGNQVALLVQVVRLVEDRRSQWHPIFIKAPSEAMTMFFPAQPNWLGLPAGQITPETQFFGFASQAYCQLTPYGLRSNAIHTFSRSNPVK
jgi:hypothetical protein